MGELIVRERLSSAAREEIAEDELGVPPRGGRRGGGGGFRHRPHHHHGFRRGPFFRESFITPAILYYGMPVEDEVAGHVQSNECFVLQWGADPTGVRPAVISALKARGWVERVDVRPRSGFNVKVRLLCPPPAEAVQPQSVTPQPALMVVHNRREVMNHGIGYIEGIGQITPRIRVLVTDRRGEPAPGIKVTVVPTPGSISVGTTDDDGAFLASVSLGTTRATVSADLPEGTTLKTFDVYPSAQDNLVVFRSVRKINGPLVTPLEGGAAVLGIGLFILGEVLKSDALKMVGEIGFIAAVFTRVGRG